MLDKKGDLMRDGVPETDLKGTVQAVMVKPEPERVLLAWKAPLRVFKPRNREFWVTIFAMGGILGMILFFVEGWMPVAVIVSFVFFIYVVSTVPPEEIEHRITNKGVIFGEKTYRWNIMVRFWFDEKWGQRWVNLDMAILPGRIQLLLGKESEEQVKEILKTYLIEERPVDTWVDRAGKWFAKKVPLE